jgi:aerobic-type carbon monoxide dehydrogenase small subunit (CoxS/CutS family)
LSALKQITLTINGANHSVELPGDMPLLWVLRDTLNLAGTRYGCGTGGCGTCTVLVDGLPVQSCNTKAAAVEGKRVTTIEGLSPDRSHPVQRAWDDGDVPACGYCQPGHILAASALLESNPRPSDADIDAALAPILCRCDAYPTIRAAVRRAAALIAPAEPTAD